MILLLHDLKMFNNIEVITDKSDFVELWILDNLGRKVKSFPQGVLPQGLNIFHLDVRDLPNGIYWGQVKSSQLSETFKLVKIN